MQCTERPSSHNCVGNWPKLMHSLSPHPFSCHDSSQSPGVHHCPPWWNRQPRKLQRQRPTLCTSRLSSCRRLWANRCQQVAGELTTWAPSSVIAAPWLQFFFRVWALSLVSSKKKGNRVTTGLQVFRERKKKGTQLRASGHSSSKGH